MSWTLISRFSITISLSDPSVCVRLKNKLIFKEAWQPFYLAHTAEHKGLALVVPVCSHSQVHFLGVGIFLEGLGHPQDGIGGAHLHSGPPWAEKHQSRRRIMMRMGQQTLRKVKSSLIRVHLSALHWKTAITPTNRKGTASSQGHEPCCFYTRHTNVLTVLAVLLWHAVGLMLEINALMWPEDTTVT